MDESEQRREFEKKRSETFDPTKSCCGRKKSEHDGPTCPDGLTMCCMCFHRFVKEDLAIDEDEVVWNMCKKCWNHDMQTDIKERKVNGTIL